MAIRISFFCVLLASYWACKKPDCAGVWFEEVATSEDSSSLFAGDNHIYKIGRTFRYAVHCKDSSGNPTYFQSEADYAKDFIVSDTANQNSLQYMDLLVNPRPKNADATYHQTHILYVPVSAAGDQMTLHGTGVVENENNIWLHPPRIFFLRDLQLCPFPFIQFPAEVGNTYCEELTVGTKWLPTDWTAGAIVKKSEHRITEVDDQYITIASKFEHAVGNGYLHAVFHKDRGFTNMRFQMIDGSTVVFDLIRMKARDGQVIWEP